MARVNINTYQYTHFMYIIKLKNPLHNFGLCYNFLFLFGCCSSWFGSSSVCSDWSVGSRCIPPVVYLDVSQIWSILRAGCHENALSNNNNNTFNRNVRKWKTTAKQQQQQQRQHVQASIVYIPDTVFGPTTKHFHTYI